MAAVNKSRRLGSCLLGDPSPPAWLSDDPWDDGAKKCPDLPRPMASCMIDPFKESLSLLVEQSKKFMKHWPQLQTGKVCKNVWEMHLWSRCLVFYGADSNLKFHTAALPSCHFILLVLFVTTAIKVVYGLILPAPAATANCTFFLAPLASVWNVGHLHWQAAKSDSKVSLARMERTRRS